MQLTIADAALAEAEEARAYYASIRPELGDDFALTLNRAFDLIANGPLLWSPIGSRARRYVLSRFPYSVVYRVRQDAIVVIAVMHQHRRPGYWQGR